ncbi:unnamed protein product [Rhizoctonia solani]|uniref:Glycoside hydrolase family 5 domain-containing protein n=1 Tax=Rhizoctonia solani TaxID=456999 RepID=A0A8H3CVR2_9AGAM|nr:unnamed protein product [Rhizoctonia solani]
MSPVQIKVPPPPAPSPLGVLKIEGSKIVGNDGKPVLLRGAGLGGHLNMENFIALFILVDIPNSAELQCAHHGIYTILDLHAAPGGQNVDWHCDTGIHRALFWEHIEFQNRAIALWEELARRYKGNTWVAGYNPLNEPTDEEHTRVLDWYARAEKAIHAIDPDHIVSTEAVVGLNVVLIYNIAVLGWKYFCCRLLPVSTTFTFLVLPFLTPQSFGDPLPGSVYSIHDYSNYGFPQISEPYEGTPEQKEKLESSFKRKIAYHEKTGGHIWNGEL